jgi:hypothetical protein
MAVLKISNKHADNEADYYKIDEKQNTVFPFREILKAYLPQPHEQVIL